MSRLGVGMDMSQDEMEPLIFRSFRDQRDTTPSTLRSRACWPLYIAVALERLAWYSVIVNQTIYLTKSPLCWPSYVAVSTQLTTSGIMYIVGLLGGWISDSYAGHYPTIISGYVIYIIGYTLLFGVTYFLPPSNEWTYEGIICNQTDGDILSSTSHNLEHSASALIFTSLIVIGLGAGLVRTNLIPFGGDQIYENGSTETRLFFTRYYWAVNLGCLFAFAVISLVQMYSFFYGYLLSLVALLASILFFAAGTGLYKRRAAGAGNVITSVIHIIQNAKKVKKENPGLVLDNFLDYANMDYDGGQFNVNQISDVRQLGRVFRVFLMTIPYWLCYSQIDGSMFLMQGLHLRIASANSTACHTEDNTCTRISDLASQNLCKQLYIDIPGTTYHTTQIPVPGSMLGMFNNIFILLTVPFVQRVYGLLASNHIKVYTWRRMLVGMLMAVAALALAGILETARLWDLCNCGFAQQRIDGRVYGASPSISIWWQIPQYALVSASEIFMILTAIEYAYVESPRNMQGIVMGALWCAAGLGAFLGISLPYIFYGLGIWSDLNNVNCMRLDISLYILAVFLAIFSFVFAFVAKKYDLSLSKVIIDRPDRQRSSGDFSRYRSIDSTNSNAFEYLDESYDYAQKTGATELM